MTNLLMIAHVSRNFRSRRWYLKIFHNVVNTTIINCWIIRNKEHPGVKYRRRGLRDFRRSLALQLIYPEPSDDEDDEEESASPAGPVRDSKVNDGLRLNGKFHEFVESDVRLDCKVHINRKQVTTMCATCKVHMCTGCFSVFHTKKQYRFEDDTTTGIRLMSQPSNRPLKKGRKRTLSSRSTPQPKK